MGEGILKQGESRAYPRLAADSIVAPLGLVNESPFVLPSTHDAMLLLLPATGCTLLPFALSLVALRHLSAFSIALAINLEPIYAIALAAVLLGEQRELAATFYVGVAVIVLVVFLHPWLTWRPPLIEPNAAAAADRRDRDTNDSV